MEASNLSYRNWLSNSQFELNPNNHKLEMDNG